MTHEEEINGEGKRERSALDHHESQNSPPGEAARAELVRRQVGDGVGEAWRRNHMITGSGSRFSSFGQNQAVSAIAQGMMPKAMAQGEKMEAMNTTPTAIAEMKDRKSTRLNS